MAKYDGMTKDELVALLASRDGKLGAMQRQLNAASNGHSDNGQDSTPEAEAPKKGKVYVSKVNGRWPSPEAGKSYLNVNGYPCRAPFTAYTSSQKLVRHFSGKCWCKENDPKTPCRAVKNGLTTRDTFNSQPGLKMPTKFQVVDA